jgi:Na+-driven multidrug efflux pump
MLAYYLAGLVKAESKFKVVVISSVCCNVLNIGLTCLLILVAKLDMYGGSTSAVISQAVNLSVVLIYIGYMNRKQNT